ncbi:phage capsid protein [Pigmentiphaga litoralis]|uniref:phage major capsid protein n=1 Tax=Pigmentiphaga litoralis TaxID=516702 RepID=UPI00198CDCC3|nr:phage major capsid protein [Pigmentiphaga litoralis]GGX32760.1 phage capsid protein [Pigmentiphaga litoralis]
MKHHSVPRGIVRVRAEAPLSGDVQALMESLNKAFADFKTEHTKQLEEVKKGNHDALQALKVERINADIGTLQKAVDTLNTQIASAQMGGGAGAKGPKDPEYTNAFSQHMKRGDVNAAMTKGEATDGGFLAPIEWDRTITNRMVLVSPMRGIASVQKISGAGYRKLFNSRGAGSGWVGETDPRPETDTPKLASLDYIPGEIYANPAATQQLLDDAEIDLEAWLAEEVEGEFALQEGIAFLTGNGVNKPTGLLTYVAGRTNATKHPWGAIQTVNTGSAAAITSDSLIDLTTALPGEYTANARFLMNRSTQGAIRKLKDGNGNYLWQPSFVAGQPATVAGYPVTEMPGMPDVAANSVAAVFGDFKRGYQIVDRTGVRVLRDPFTNKPYVHFYTTKRVGGGLLNPDVLKALKVAA